VATAGMDERALALAGAAAAGAALVVLVAGGWVNGLLVTALAVPLPALVSTSDLRIAAAAPITAAVVAGWLLSLAPTAAGAAGAPGAAGAAGTAGTAGVPAALRRATLLLLGTLAIATVFASSLPASLRELVNMATLLAFLLLAIGRARIARDADHTIAVLTAAAAACGALAVLEMVGVLPGSFPRWGTPFHRAALGFGQPNGLGLFLAIALPLGVHAVRSSSGAARTAAAVGLLTIAAGLFATFSRGSWLAVVAGAFALAFVGETRLLVRFLIGAIMVAVVLEVGSGGMLSDTAQRTLTDWVIEQRAALMLAGVLMFLAHPVTGVGPGGFAAELDSFGARIPALWDYLPTPHNAYVQMAAETGAIGLAAYLVFLVVCIRLLARRVGEAQRAGADARELSLRRCLLWSFATSCFAGLVVWPYAHGIGQAVLLLLAIGIARQPAARST
jgi:O-antigen ligase